MLHCGEETLVQSQPGLSHQLFEQTGKCLDLCLSVSWTPLPPPPAPQSSPFTLPRLPNTLHSRHLSVRSLVWFPSRLLPSHSSPQLAWSHHPLPKTSQWLSTALGISGELLALTYQLPCGIVCHTTLARSHKCGSGSQLQLPLRDLRFHESRVQAPLWPQRCLAPCLEPRMNHHTPGHVKREGRIRQPFRSCLWFLQSLSAPTSNSSPRQPGVIVNRWIPSWPHQAWLPFPCLCFYSFIDDSTNYIII